MKIKLLSDLHLEAFFGKGLDRELDRLFTQQADVLVLAGDIHVGAANVQYVLDAISHRYPNIIYIAGNHEYYKHGIDEMEKLELPDNVHFLDPGIVEIEGVKFAGATLWTDFNDNKQARMDARHFINDFRIIANFNTFACAERYRKEWAFIVNNKADVVVTHFLPAQACISPRFRHSTLNDYFATDNDEYIMQMQNTKYWFFGHTHDHIDITLGKVRLIANPLGYSHEANSPVMDLYEI